MKKIITFYFSFCEIVEGKNEDEIISKAEELTEKELGNNCWDYFDDRTIENVRQ